MIKQHGALLAKGRIPAIQFDTLFTDGLYMKIGKPAIEAARRIREVLDRKGYEQVFRNPTNQIFILLDDAQAEMLSAKVEMSFMERMPDSRILMRICTSWATDPADTDRLIACL